MQDTTRERGNLQHYQGQSPQVTAANNGSGSLDFGRDMAAGRQADSAAEIGAREWRSGTASDRGLPTSNTGRSTKEGVAVR